MSIKEKKEKMHFKCLLCGFVIKSRGHHLEFWHDDEIDRFYVRGIIGSENQDALFSKYYVETIEPVTSAHNKIDYNPRIDCNESIRIRSSKYALIVRGKGK
jgi:hypothetical protein